MSTGPSCNAGQSEFGLSNTFVRNCHPVFTNEQIEAQHICRAIVTQLESKAWWEVWEEDKLCSSWQVWSLERSISHSKRAQYTVHSMQYIVKGMFQKYKLNTWFYFNSWFHPFAPYRHYHLPAHSRMQPLTVKINNTECIASYFEMTFSLTSPFCILFSTEN